ncbi:hypothetical protein CCMA1212_010029 [Trichoderma ghanense]|uniref:Cell division cycle protein 123 n=1 Tax=Trichoderma ghanense TaxID=65468 RepID=A0ABY2GRE3_9HYPO
MPLRIIDNLAIQRELKQGATTKLNTSLHTAAEAPRDPIPSNKPFSFDKWLPLILRSREIPASALQVVVLRRPQIELLAKAAAASIHTRELNRAYAEDLEEQVHPAFQALTFPPEGLFMRLGACPPKDGAHTAPGVLALRSVEDIVLRMTTSLRARSALTNVLNSDAEETQAYFLPFDDRLQPFREYRVFCCPESLRITAVSQYEWHKPWTFAHFDKGVMSLRAQLIVLALKRLQEKILEFMLAHEDRELEGVIRRQGFTFDAVYDRGMACCKLIELNTFGVRSACGSCLFHWLEDRALLYGASVDIECRVTVAHEDTTWDEETMSRNEAVLNWLESFDSRRRPRLPE